MQQCLLDSVCAKRYKIAGTGADWISLRETDLCPFLQVLCYLPQIHTLLVKLPQMFFARFYPSWGFCQNCYFLLFRAGKAVTMHIVHSFRTVWKEDTAFRNLLFYFFNWDIIGLYQQDIILQICIVRLTMRLIEHYCCC